MIRVNTLGREFTEEERREAILPLALGMVELEYNYARLSRLYREWEECSRREGAKDYEKESSYDLLIQEIIDFRNWGETAFSELFKALNLT